MATPRNYKAGKDAVFTVDSIVLAVVSGNFKHTMDFDEATNTTSGGHYSSIPTIDKAEGSFDLTYDGDVPLTFKAGDLVDATLLNSGAPGFTGPIYIDSVDYKTADVKGKVGLSVDWHSEEGFVINQS